MRKRTAKLEWSSRDYSRDHILVSDYTQASCLMMDKIFLHTGKQSTRLTISKHKYFYAPSEEWKSFVLRFKRTK